MNLRTFTAISAVSMLMLGGCIIVDSTNSNKGGAGGDGTGNTGNTGTAGKGGAGTAGAGGAGTAGAGGACSTSCADVITNDTTPCVGSNAEKLNTALIDCVCGPMGVCQPACAASKCMGMKPDDTCTKCITDSTVDMTSMKPNGCGAEFGLCSGDI